MSEKTEPDRPWRQFLDDLRRAWPPSNWRDLGVVVGCSGGADSVALLRGLAQLRGEESGDATGFVISAHFNHALRGEESDADEESVRDLSTNLGVRYVRGSQPTCSQSQSRDDEAALRRVRLDFLLQTARRCGARYIATAHSIDDNVETLLHHLMRGTGPAGIAGIAKKRPVGHDYQSSDFVLVRPLLRIRRSTIRDALQSIGQPWREDSSNENTRYRRNWIRHQLIPMIESKYPSAVDAMARAIEEQGHWRATMDRLGEQWLEKNRRIQQPPELTHDDETDPAIITAGLQRLWDMQGWPRGDLTQSHWCRIVDTLQSKKTCRYSVPGPIDVVSTAEGVRLEQKRD